MNRMHSVAEIFRAIQQTKSNAPAFRTNFFPVEEKLQGGLDRGEWLGASGAATALFLRQDRDFWHLYFSTASVAALRIDLAACVELKAKPVTVDLVGREAVQELSPIFELAGFRSRARLLRLVSLGQPICGTAVPDQRVAPAEPIDCPAIVDLLLRSFDRYAEQIPELHELEAAARRQQVLLVKDGDKAIAVLYFESHGVTSHIRYWLVDEPFRAAGYGSALMRRYAAIQSKAKRFILWVLANNEEALRKYRHYGYAPDGLVDHVLANSLIDPPSKTGYPAIPDDSSPEGA